MTLSPFIQKTSVPSASSVFKPLSSGFSPAVFAVPP